MSKPRRYDIKRPWLHLYDRARYKRMRAMRLQEEPLCRYCMSRFKRVTEATVCDHIVPHKGDEDMFFDYANTQSLCKPCHDQHKQREELGLVEKLVFGADGYPI